MSAKGDGPRHWWAMKMSAVALIPLSLWMLSGLIRIAGSDQAAAQAWLKAPLHGVTLGVFLFAALYHSEMGVGEVITDYVSTPSMQKFALSLNKVVHLAVAALAIVAMLSLLGYVHA